MVAATRQARLRYERYKELMATTTFPTRDDFETLLNESLGGENETFEGKVVKGIVTGIENDMAVIDVGLKSEGGGGPRGISRARGEGGVAGRGQGAGYVRRGGQFARGTTAARRPPPP